MRKEVVDRDSWWNPEEEVTKDSWYEGTVENDFLTRKQEENRDQLYSKKKTTNTSWYEETMDFSPRKS